ncbi:MAG: hypothetical protein J6C65_01850 [Prevotella sp.]|nr:hypothetical protein [Prevotella sp.]
MAATQKRIAKRHPRWRLYGMRNYCAFRHDGFPFPLCRIYLRCVMSASIADFTTV